MESLLWLFLVLITLAIIHIVQAQDQTGFISLDCGLSANELSPYTETSTGIQYYSDASYIQTGKTASIQASLQPMFAKPHTTLRYFPEGRRNCYNLTVEKGRNHLIRARFVYGNYDGRNISPKFDLYLGPNLWTTVDLNGFNEGRKEEIIHIPTSNLLQICLVNTSMGSPVIAALEIRPLGNSTYITQSGSLKLQFRRYLNNSETTIRYPNDVYDREWIATTYLKKWTQISNTRDVGNSSLYELPEKALIASATPTNASEPLTVEWTESPDGQCYWYAHITEIQDLQENDTREFNISSNGESLYNGSFSPDHTLTTLHSASPGACNLQLTRTNRSTLPPLLNAYEVYTIIRFPLSETNESDVAAIRSITTTHGLSRIDWQGDPCVPLQLRWDGLNCTNTGTSTPPRITSLNLASSGLNGSIPAAIEDLTLLETLDLSNNNLTGEVPEFLGNMESLSVINLSGNDLSGLIPQALQRKGLELLIEGNPRLCLSNSCRKSSKKKVLLPILVSVGSAAIVIVVLVIFLVLRKKKSTVVEGLHPPPRKSTLKDSFANKNSRKFTYSEVIQMTNNFQRVLGRGGFGKVYHGTVNGSQQVAVKLLSQSSNQGYKEFKAEVDLLLRVHHINLVSLVGYCYEGDHLALIYEFLPNGDLKQHLTGKGGKSIINWSNRLRIALEAAQGLEYLHIGCTPPMVHRDVKTANILLGENFNAKLADFGLTRSFQVEGESQQSTMMAGTLGYLDPEYGNLCRLTEKSDVYSFGIVLLEIITNQPVISQTSEYSYITQWVAFKLNRGDIIEIMDSNLGKDYDTNSAWRALELAMSCTNPSSSKRPSMSNVIHELKECIVCENSGMSKNQGFQAEEMNLNMDTSVVPIAR